MTDVRVTALVSGHVQGVGFRYWVRQQADPLQLSGSATNLRDGRVEVVAQGARTDVESLLAALRGGDTPGRVSDVVESWSDATGSDSTGSDATGGGAGGFAVR